MASNERFLRYEEEIKLEQYGATCIDAKIYLQDLRNDIKGEKQISSGFITVNEYSKKLSNKKIRAW